MTLNGKRILITSGPTWVPIDSVRIISNIATGKTGFLLAQEAAVRGAKVTLVMGPCGGYNLNESYPFYNEQMLYSKRGRAKSIRTIHFRFFNELKSILQHELKDDKYDVVIHSAAGSDFKPKYKLTRKLNSHKSYSLQLTALEKLVILIRHLAKKAKLVMFKLESGISDKTLIRTARQAKREVAAELAVANCLNPYRAFIIDENDALILAKDKRDLAKKLIKTLCKYFNP